MLSETLPESVTKKATNIVRDSRQAIAVGLIPILGLIFILRLVQWYLMKGQYPQLIDADSGVDAGLVNDFRSALPRLWFAVLFWPAMIVFIVVYMLVTD